MSVKKQPLVVELVGPAGAGKSTLSRILRGRDGTLRAGLSVWRLPLPLLIANALLSLPTLLSLRRASRWFRWDEMKAIVRLNALDQLLGRESSKKYKTLVLEEGAVFALAKLYAFGHQSIKSRPFEKWWQAVFNHWAGRVDVIIWLDARDPTLAQRIRTRRPPHPVIYKRAGRVGIDLALVKDKNDGAMYEFLARYRAAFEHVISGLVAGGGPKMMTFSTDRESTDQIADQILAALNGEWDEQQ